MNNIDRFFTEDIENFSKSYFDYLKNILASIDVFEIKKFIDTLLNARKNRATIFFIGNGGSAATASHFANDLAFGINTSDPFKAMSINDNVPVLTALSNDHGYEDIFIRQLKVYGKEGDVLVGISASGNSENILRAFKYAASNGILTVALTGFDGGKMKFVADQGLHIPTDMKEYGPADDAHLVIDHLVSSYLMRIIRD